jgi:hypothetical protein
MPRRLTSIPLFVIPALLALASCRSSEPPPPARPVAAEDWRIEPGARVGSLRASGSEQDLVLAYGAGQVRDTSIALGEGETAPGAILFPEDPQRRLEIVWADAGAKRAPRRVILRGERSRWMLPRGVSLGTSLRELEEKNGAAFRLAGFAWDYAGVVMSWEGGALDSALGAPVKLYLAPRIEDRAGPDYSRVLGDRPFPSSHPAMQALNPRVYRIFVDFGAAE